MYWFFVEKEQIQEDTAFIIGPDVNHIKNVLRMRQSDKLRICDGQSLCYVCEILTFEEEETGAGRIRLKILEKDENGTELPAQITLYQGLPKGDKMEWIIQKNVELGIARIVPVATKRTVVKLDAKKAENKVRRWNAIAESAAKQSKRTVIPQVTEVLSFPEAIRQAAASDCRLIPYENEEGMERTRSELKKICPGSSVSVFIGPEGGFEPEEIELAREAGFIPISLGRRILRTETAGMALMAVLMMQLDQ